MTTNRDIDRLRAAAATGERRSDIAKRLGRTVSWVNYWSERERIAVNSSGHSWHPALADLALARLRATMQRLDKVSHSGAADLS